MKLKIKIKQKNSAATTARATADSVALPSTYSPPSVRWALTQYQNQGSFDDVDICFYKFVLQVADFTFTLYRVPDNIYGVFDHQTKVNQG